MTSQNDKASNMDTNQTIDTRSPYKRAIDVYINNYIERLNSDWDEEEAAALRSFFHDLSQMDAKNIQQKLLFVYKHVFLIPNESHHVIFDNAKDKLKYGKIKKCADEVVLLLNDIDYYLESNNNFDYFDTFKFLSVLLYIEKNIIITPKKINKFLRKSDVINKLQFYLDFDDIDFSDTLTFLEDIEEFHIKLYQHDIVDEIKGNKFWEYILKEQGKINIQKKYEKSKYENALEEFIRFLKDYNYNISLEEKAQAFCDEYNDRMREKFKDDLKSYEIRDKKILNDKKLINIYKKHIYVRKTKKKSK